MRSSLFLVLLMVGCAGSVTAPVEFSEYTKYDQPTTESLWTTRPVGLQAEVDAPYDGLLVTVGTWQAMKEELDRLRAALDKAYRLIEESRRHARAEDKAKREALAACRKSKAESMGMSYLAGVATCASAERLIQAVKP